MTVLIVGREHDHLLDVVDLAHTSTRAGGVVNARVVERINEDTFLVGWDLSPETPKPVVPEPKLKVAIRAGEYQDKSGYFVRELGGHFGHGVFVETRRAAEMCKALLVAGRSRDITMDHLLGIEPLWWDSEAS